MDGEAEKSAGMPEDAAGVDGPGAAMRDDVGDKS